MRTRLLIATTLVATACSPQAGVARSDAPADLTSISQVQGSGARSPLEGRTVTVEGRVSGDFVAGLGGFFLQSDTPDDDPATSEGIFVAIAAEGHAAWPVGQRLRVTGVVAETGQAATTLTSIEGATWVDLGAGTLVPQPLDAAPADWEAYEGMAVRITAPLTVTGNDGLARFGELATSFAGRQFAPTDLAPAGSGPALAAAAANGRQALRLDDGSGQQDPKALWFLPQAVGDPAPLRTGSVITGAQGVVDSRYGGVRLQLTEKFAAVQQAARPPAPTVPGNRRIAGFNVLNLFNGDGAGGGFPTERGAQSAQQFARQQAKLVSVVQALDPDLAALMELENDGYGPASSLAQFVAALNAAGPHRDWRYLDSVTGPGTNPIRVGLVYRSSRFQAVGKPAMLAEGPFVDRSRVPLAQAFRAGTGPVFVVVANHFKSKGGCGDAIDADADRSDGQACYNGTRVDSARRLADWLATDPTGTAPRGTLVIGDLNAHSQEDPLRLLHDRGWQSAFAMPGDQDATGKPYSFVFAGQSASLDHALLDRGLAGRLRGAAHWHINADESDFFDYRRETDSAGQPNTGPYRASDHDPMLLGLDLAE